MLVHDLIHVKTDLGDTGTFYVVTGVYLGGVGEAHAVTVSPVQENYRNGSGYDTDGEFVVPHAFIEALISSQVATLFRAVNGKNDGGLNDER